MNISFVDTDRLNYNNKFKKIIRKKETKHNFRIKIFILRYN